MFQAIIAKYCLIPMSVALSVIHVESSGNPRALLKDLRNPAMSSYGLMQLTFATAKGLSCGVSRPEDLYNSETNIRCGCKYLNYQIKRYKNVKAALVAYNQGSVLLDGKIVKNSEGLTDRALSGVKRNVYATKVLTHQSKICQLTNDCSL